MMKYQRHDIYEVSYYKSRTSFLVFYESIAFTTAWQCILRHNQGFEVALVIFLSRRPQSGCSSTGHRYQTSSNYTFCYKDTYGGRKRRKVIWYSHGPSDIMKSPWGWRDQVLIYRGAVLEALLSIYIISCRYKHSRIEEKYLRGTRIGHLGRWSFAPVAALFHGRLLYYCSYLDNCQRYLALNIILGICLQ